MTAHQNMNKLKAPNPTYLQEGKRLGSKAAFLLSILYATLGIFIIEVIWQKFGVFGKNLLDNDPVTIFIFVIVIYILAIFPAIVLGAFTGIYLGKLAEVIKGRISNYSFVFLCVLSCTIIAIGIHLILQIPIVLSFQIPPASSQYDYFPFIIYATYPFVMGIPTIIYIFAGGWVGWKLYVKFPI